jgi:hypothetical protein
MSMRDGEVVCVTEIQCGLLPAEETTFSGRMLGLWLRTCSFSAVICAVLRRRRPDGSMHASKQPSIRIQKYCTINSAEFQSG